MEFARVDEDRCQWLRSRAGNFWCHKTHQCIGPDAKLADNYECNETRACYEAL
jgi:hypothetical protein